jgi:hypothetical protein
MIDAAVAQLRMTDTKLAPGQNLQARYRLLPRGRAQSVDAIEVVRDQTPLLVRRDRDVRRAYVRVIENDIIAITASDSNGKGFDRKPLNDAALAVKYFNVA